MKNRTQRIPMQWPFQLPTFCTYSYASCRTRSPSYYCFVMAARSQHKKGLQLIKLSPHSPSKPTVPNEATRQSCSAQRCKVLCVSHIVCNLHSPKLLIHVRHRFSRRWILTFHLITSAEDKSTTYHKAINVWDNNYHLST